MSGQRNLEDIYPLTPLQEGILFHSLVEKEASAYYVQLSFRIHLELNVSIIEKSLHLLMQRHAPLRTAFVHEGVDRPMQVVLKDRKPDFYYEDIRETVKPGKKEEFLVTFREKDKKRYFDFVKDALLRFSVIRLGETTYQLIWSFHHLLMDGWCLSILIKEFFEIYTALQENRAPHLPEVKPYKTYIQWLEKRDRDESRDYWTRYLRDFEEQTGIPRKAKKESGEFKRENVIIHIDPVKNRQLVRLVKENKVTLNSLLHTVWGILLGKYRGRQDALFGAVVSGRPPELEGVDTMIGLFINTIPVRVRYEQGTPFNDLLKKIQAQALESEPHHYCPLAEIQQSSELKQDLFDHILVFDNFPIEGDPAGRVGGIVDLEALEPTNFDFNLKIIAGEEIRITIVYNANIYDRRLVRRIPGHFHRILDQVLANLLVHGDEISFITGEEQNEILYHFNRAVSEVSYPRQQTLHLIFEEQVDKYPDKIAVIINHRHLTYKELNGRANRLARFLRRKGIKPDQVVGIMLDRSLEMIIGLLGILKAGGAYLPLPLDFPEERIHYMLEDTDVALCLTRECDIKSRNFTVFLGLRQVKHPPVVTPTRPQIRDLDSLPLPNRSLVDHEKYHKKIGMAMVKHCISLHGTRGCPYLCKYCHKIFPKTHIARSAENILSEIMLYYNLGVRRFSLIDDVFNLKRDNSQRLYQLIIKNRLDIQLFFPNGVRGDILTPGEIDLMVEAGTTTIALALETASPRLQKLVGKHLKIDVLRDIIEYTASRYPHLVTELFTMHGFPSETEEEAMGTLDFVKSIKWLHFPYVHILKIYPNTEMADLALQHGVTRDAIYRAEGIHFHDLPDTLPFEKSFTINYQANFLNTYFLSKERLLWALPYQMKVFTEDEMVQKYNSYLPEDITNFPKLLDFIGITREELGEVRCLDEREVFVPDLNRKIKSCFPEEPPDEDALRIFLLDVSLLFTERRERLNLFEPSLGLINLLTYLKQEFGPRVHGKIAKSRVDFDSYEELKSMLEEFRPQVIGIRALSLYKNFYHEILAIIRQWGFDCPIIAGGPYASSSYQTMLQDPAIDLAVLGEGEVTFVELIEKIMENKGKLPGDDVLTKIKGITYIPAEIRRRKNFGREIIHWEALNPQLAGESALNPEPVNQPRDTAYLIYTSGTTGKPKGTMIQHNNVVQLLFNNKLPFDFTGSDVWTMFHTYNFDFSVWEMYGALLYGGKLVLVPENVAREPEGFLQLLKEEGVTVLNQTPMVFYNIIEEELKHPDRCMKARYVIFGGEALTPSRLKKWIEKYPQTKLVNMYGITETTVHVTYKEIGPREIETNTSNIGQPLAPLTTYVLDKNLALLPKGIALELCVGGAGVGRGYLNRPALTREKFIDNPYRPGDRLYRSGDSGRWLEDGDLEYLGRIDTQVKIRGFRIEPGEIENQLLAHELIKEAVVMVKQDKSQEKYLCGYIVSEKQFQASELREYLAGHLPDYMIPSYFVQLPHLPLTRNRKIDRAALPEPDGSWQTGVEYLAPTNETETRLLEIWRSVLPLPRIGIKDNFFTIGGDSIKTIRLLNLVNETFGTQLKIVDIYDNETIEKLGVKLSQSAPPAREIAGQLRQEIITEMETIKERFLSRMKDKTRGETEIEDIYPMNDIEKGLVYYYMKSTGNPMYHDQFVYQVRYPGFDFRRFREAMALIVEKHSNLRAGFNLEDPKQPVKVIRKQLSLDTRYIDISHLEPQQQEEHIRKFMEEDRRHPFKNDAPPLWRMVIFDTGSGNLVVTWIAHHTILDGWSNANLMAELNNIYQELAVNPSFIPEKLKTTYKESVIEQWLEKRTPETINYWKRELANYRRLEFPAAGEPEKGARKTYTRNLGPDFLQKVLETARLHNSSLKNLTFAPYMYILSIFTPDNDVVAGLATNIRPLGEDGDRVAGCFLNTIPVRIKIPASITWAGYIQLVDRKMTELKRFERLSFFEILRVTGEKTSQRNPIFDALFSQVDFYAYQEAQTENTGITLENRLSLRKYETANPLFTFVVNTTFKEFEIIIDYSPAVFKDELIQQLCDFFCQILQCMIDDPDSLTTEKTLTPPGKKSEGWPDLVAAQSEAPQINFQF